MLPAGRVANEFGGGRHIECVKFARALTVGHQIDQRDHLNLVPDLDESRCFVGIHVTEHHLHHHIDEGWIEFDAGPQPISRHVRCMTSGFVYLRQVQPRDHLLSVEGSAPTGERKPTAS